MGGASDAVLGGGADGLNLRVLLVGGAKGGRCRGSVMLTTLLCGRLGQDDFRGNMAAGGASVSKTQSLRSKLTFSCVSPLTSAGISSTDQSERKSLKTED